MRRFSPFPQRASVAQSTDFVVATTTKGQKLSASHVVYTITVNVLHRISFNPPLPKEEIEASTEGQVNGGVKIHCTHPPQPTPPNPVLFGFSKSNIPNAGSFSVFFCPANELETSSFESLVHGFRRQVEGEMLLPERVEVGEIMCHDWMKDEFA